MTSLEEAIDSAARAKITAYERYLRRLHDENERRSRRSAVNVHQLVPRRPTMWSLDRSFDPFHVRARKSSIAHAIRKRLDNSTYAPLRPGGFWIPKDHGKSRLVTAFSIADEVVSGRIYRSLLSKNRSRLSGHSYAYRDDLNVHDAISYIQSEWQGEHRLFIAQYDFANFFDSISHEYVAEIINSLRLTMTSLERRVVNAFLWAPAPYTSHAEKALPSVARTRGVHQGTSISLLIANLALTPLDRDIERLNVSFTRYADDLVIWSRDYASVCRAVESLHEHAARSGVSLNNDKSSGIKLLVAGSSDRAELPKATSIEYLSHAVGLRSTRMHDKVEKQIKRRVSTFLFNHLLREPLRGTQNSSRISPVNDRDYIAFIWQLRRYIYGRLSEADVRRHQSSPIPAMQLTGAAARFPLIDSEDQLRDLDRWIAAQTWLALRRRQRLLAPRFLWTPEPWGLSRPALINFKTISYSTGQSIDARLPSFLRMSNVVARAVRSHGTRVVGPGLGLYGYKT